MNRSYISDHIERDLVKALERRDIPGIAEGLTRLQACDPEQFEGVCLAMEVGLSYRAAVAPVITRAVEHHLTTTSTGGST